MKQMTPEYLVENDGRPGSKTLIAVNGSIYDVSESNKWKHGLHMNRHRAGKDLTPDLTCAPHGSEVLERFPPVGTLSEPRREAYRGARALAESFLAKHPFFRRHPHPSVVHIPVGVLTAAPILEAVALITGSARTEWAAVCCLIVGLAAIPGAIMTGYFAWWVNYECGDSRIISTKRRLAWIALATGVAAGTLRTFVNDSLRLDDVTTILYLVAFAGLSGLVGIVGFLGGKLTFPYE